MGSGTGTRTVGVKYSGVKWRKWGVAARWGHAVEGRFHCHTQETWCALVLAGENQAGEKAKGGQGVNEWWHQRGPPLRMSEGLCPGHGGGAGVGEDRMALDRMGAPPHHEERKRKEQVLTQAGLPTGHGLRPGAMLMRNFIHKTQHDRVHSRSSGQLLAQDPLWTCPEIPGHLTQE